MTGTPERTVRFYFDYKSDPSRSSPGLIFTKAADMEIYESPTVWPRARFPPPPASCCSPAASC